MKWTEETHNYLIELKLKGLGWKKIAKEMTDKFNKQYKPEQCRSRWRTNRHKIDTPNYKETVEIKADGSHASDKLLKLTSEQSKDSTYLLKAHGYDPNDWEITKAKTAMWNQHNKQDGTLTLYSSSIVVKPKTVGFNFDKLLENIKNVPKVNIKPTNTRKKSYLNIPLADQHFGVATFEYYKETQNKIMNLINKGHEEILFIIGNDLFHHDNHKNQTASGREIEQADMTKAWDEAKKFYYPLLEYALLRSKKVKVVYIKGNHSETFEWCFVQMLKERFEQIEFDDRYKERKVQMLGLNFIGCTHGDKKRMQNLSENFATEFPIQWSMARTRSVLTGHLHHERVIDKGGIVLRQLPSGVAADLWHDEMGYTTAHKRFQVFQYSHEAEECIHYV